MGAYLSVPDTEKHSSNENLERLSYGASSMQGWRTTQEDAHNCIPEFDDNISLFAVYDGHGGAEVAQYCSMYFPDYLKSLPAYKNGNMAQALEDAFLGFDEKLTHQEVIAELKVISGVKDNVSDTENEVDHLYAEANMPLDQVLAKYGNNDPPLLTEAVPNPTLARLKEGKPLSPFLRAKTNKCGKSDACQKPPIAMDLKDNDDDGGKIKSVNGEADADEVKTKPLVNGEGDVSGKKEASEVIQKSGDTKGQSCDSDCVEKKSKKNLTSVGGSGDCTSPSSSDSKKPSALPASEQAGCSSGKSKRSSLNPIPAADDSSDDNSSEDDKTYEGDIPYADSSDSEDDGEKEADESDDDDDDDDDEDDDDDDDEEIDEDEVDEEKEEPGSDSGCTAVVALLRGDCLYVANAGDSRCIVSRCGKAIDMSVDHKPEDELEKNRIVAAGGTVTADGRVDGGLNLSRAIGDHTYKQNKDVAAKDQMISALPDIRTLTIDPAEDEFMVLACDGIWNSMNSQEVADFVKERLRQGTDNLAVICEAMFDHCIASNTRGDGTGCDNMTAIVVKFHEGLATVASACRKRELVDKIEQPAKRQKASDVVTDGGATAVQ